MRHRYQTVATGLIGSPLPEPVPDCSYQISCESPLVTEPARVTSDLWSITDFIYEYRV